MPHKTPEGGAPWFFKKVAAFFLALIILLAIAFASRKFRVIDRFMHQYIGVPVTVWTAVGILYITGSPVTVERSVMHDGSRPNLDTLCSRDSNDHRVQIGPGCTARKHVFLVIAFALAFPLLSWKKRFILAGVTTAIMLFLSGVRVVVLFHLHGSDWFAKVHEIDGYVLAVVIAIIWIVFALWLTPSPGGQQTDGDETIVDDTPKTVAEKMSDIKQ